MDYVEIQALLKRLGVTQEELAEKINCSQSAISKVVRRKAVSHRIAKLISDFLGKPKAIVFPDYVFLNLQPTSVKTQTQRAVNGES
jgi:transcriptional regulator with XRE-family HTH domain